MLAKQTNTSWDRYLLCSQRNRAMLPALLDKETFCGYSSDSRPRFDLEKSYFRGGKADFKISILLFVALLDLSMFARDRAVFVLLVTSSAMDGPVRDRR